MRSSSLFAAGVVAGLTLMCCVCSSAHGQMMRPGNSFPQRPSMTTTMAPAMNLPSMGAMSTILLPQLLAVPRATTCSMSGYSQFPYSQMYSLPSYSYGNYGGYGANQATAGSYGAVQGSAYSSQPAPEAKETPHIDVVIGDNYFEPRELVVKAGSVVRWKNGSRNFHAVKADDGTWGSTLLGEGEIYAHTFAAPGTYRYHCVIHSKEMQAVVIVK